MEEEIRKFIQEKELSPWNKTKTALKQPGTIFKTTDARAIATKTLSHISRSFRFPETQSLWSCFPLGPNPKELAERQRFFKAIPTEFDNSSLQKLRTPRPQWKPHYASIIVTENEKTLAQLREQGCPVQFLISEYDVQALERYDVVQVIDCEDYLRALENLPQTVFVKSMDEVYPERHLEQLSGWKENLMQLSQVHTSEKISRLVTDLMPLLVHIQDTKVALLSREFVEQKKDELNKNIATKLKEMTLQGDALFEMMSRGKMPVDIENIIRTEIHASALPLGIFTQTIPININEEVLEETLTRQSIEHHSSAAGKIQKNASAIQKIPQKLRQLERELLIFDFLAGINDYKKIASTFPEETTAFSITESRNALLEKPHPITFSLDENNLCSILTGANSGGKTTLLEHVVQLVTLMQLGLPVSGSATMPLFTDVYYFAKNKGSMSKGAFETLLTQLAQIKPGEKTLILADEIEAVTEPGMASAIIAASAEYFIQQNCFLIIATHLGQEIEKKLPLRARIDGIEAKGLNEQFELIVDHNPVLGRLANSTPELIVERMTNAFGGEYFSHLYTYLQQEKTKQNASAL